MDSIKLGRGRRQKSKRRFLCWAAFDPEIRTSGAADAASEGDGENLLKQIWASRDVNLKSRRTSADGTKPCWQEVQQLAHAGGLCSSLGTGNAGFLYRGRSRFWGAGLFKNRFISTWCHLLIINIVLLTDVVPVSSFGWGQMLLEDYDNESEARCMMGVQMMERLVCSGMKPIMEIRRSGI